jgi:light-harvesting complex II chlorophyll a/b binding protein 5
VGATAHPPRRPIPFLRPAARSPSSALPRDLTDPALRPASAPRSYGYDPLGLGKDGNVEKYRAYELIHARWAMLGAAGAIIPEGLAANGADIKGAVWWETGKVMLDGDTLNYFAVPWANLPNPLPLPVVAAIQVGLLAAVESYRSSGSGPAGYSPGGGKFDSSVFEGADPLYPGGPFDPLGLADDSEALAELQVKEIKNGRLAMVSMLGFAVQAAVTREGPFANWSHHVSDPFGEPPGLVQPRAVQRAGCASQHGMRRSPRARVCFAPVSPSDARPPPVFFCSQGTTC